MGKRTALVLGRYSIYQHDDPLLADEQIALFERLRDAKPVAYRKPDPGPNDFDTYIMRPSMTRIEARRCITLDVARDIRFRQVVRTNRADQTVTAEFAPTEEAELAHFVGLPDLGVFAVEDASGEGKLGGWSAIGRLAAVVRSERGCELKTEPAGTPQDLQRAISTWSLDQFAFQARPFNPHPSTPGKIVSDLLANDQIGSVRGVALPKEGAHIHPKDEGLVKETIGLAEQGYATYGARGKTPSGAEAVVKKPVFSYDRAENKNRLAGPQQLRVFVEATSPDELNKKAVDVLVEFFVTDAET